MLVMMKKVFALLLIFLMLLALTACRTDAEDSKPMETAPAAALSPTPIETPASGSDIPLSTPELPASDTDLPNIDYPASDSDISE